MRHGPHQGAQKSTSTGMSLRVTCCVKLFGASSIGCAVNKAFLHLPQVGCAVSFSEGTRFTALQCGQTMC